MQPYSWFAALFLFLSYVIGLWFTLRTHAALIWATEAEEKRAVNVVQESSPYESRRVPFTNGVQGATGRNHGPKSSIRESQLYKRILGQSLDQVGLADRGAENVWDQTESGQWPDSTTPHVVPPPSRSDDDDTLKDFHDLPGEGNESLVRQVTEVAATVAAAAAQEGTRTRKLSAQQAMPRQGSSSVSGHQTNVAPEEHGNLGFSHEHTHPSGGHDAPNWSRAKSSIILLVATVLYAIIAEILVNTVDVVLESVDIDEKFLGITLFALVPNTTEFLVWAYLFDSIVENSS